MIGLVRLFVERPAGIGTKHPEHQIFDFPRSEATRKARELRREGWTIYHTENL